jgi:uncharacterized protein (TIGR00375 family)
MRYTADLHLHSKYSRAVSKNMILSVMAEFAKSKGIDLLSASDWTHTLWFKEIQGQLLEAGEGVYRLRSEISNFKSQISNDQKEVYFLLSTEISSIYKHGEKLRRIHNLVFVPNFAVAEKVNKELLKRGCNLSADGRPIIGLSSRNLLEMLLSIDERCLLIPCHVWTPHFGVYGSKSGFDSLDEAFGDLAPYVYGIETGISSDPEMNWRIPELANRSILSFSDAHSPANMGREATVFELEKLTYENVRQAIMRKGGLKNRLEYTIEFYPEEGKYHFSGHRSCKVSLSPEEVAGKGIVCLVCRREFTEGVAIRIEQLAGSDFAKSYKEKLSESGIMWHTDQAKNHPPYVKLVRLEQIIAAGVGTSPNTIKVKSLYAKLCKLDSEINILLKTPIEEVEKICRFRVAEALSRVRGGKISLDPGYDGLYGAVKVFNDEEKKDLKNFKSDASQMSLDI